MFLFPRFNSLNTSEEAIIPDFIAVCVPLIFGVFSVPASHPINAPPGKESFGKDCQPPSFKALAP